MKKCKSCGLNILDEGSIAKPCILCHYEERETNENSFNNIELLTVREKFLKSKKIIEAFLGLAIGDALGVPVEFLSREEFFKNPVKDMISGGTHGQPLGTWSDDSFLSFCLAEALILDYDLNNIGKNFLAWYTEGFWTARGEVFDIGISTSKALQKIEKGLNPVNAGGESFYDNGNGSLMRILPLAFYVKDFKDDEKFKIIKEVSSITHGHDISIISCSFYIEMAINIINNIDVKESYRLASKKIRSFYKEHDLSLFDRILNEDISKYSKDEIKSTGYVIHSLEAVLWSLLNNHNFKDTVLAAVNLGEDTDTIASIVGGMAAIYYGINSIPTKWILNLARVSDITNLALEFSESLNY